MQQSSLPAFLTFSVECLLWAQHWQMGWLSLKVDMLNMCVRFQAEFVSLQSRNLLSDCDSASGVKTTDNTYQGCDG